MGFYFGLSAAQLTLDADALNTTLNRNGYRTLGTSSYGGTMVETIRVGRLRVDAGGGLWTLGARDPKISTAIAGTIEGGVGFDVVREGGWVLTPRVGAGVGLSRLCVRPAGSSAPIPTASTFDDALANPVDETCLHTQAFVLRPGLAIAYETPMKPSAEKVGLGWRIGANVSYALPVSSAQWERDGAVDAGKIGGPDAPYRGVFIGLEVAFVTGFF